MKKKIFVVSILAVFMLVAISVVSAVNSNTVKPVEKKIIRRVLFEIRAARAIGDRLKDLRESIKARFLGDRVFLLDLPFQWLRNKDDLSIRNRLMQKDTEWDFTCPGYYTCWDSYPCN